MNSRILALALAIESLLAALAMFGGPHGDLGAWPWALQMPGILLVLFLPGDAGFAWRAAGIFVIQTACWYAICSMLRRRMILSAR